MTRSFLLFPLVALAACVDSTDPGDGGFINGVSGIATGTYEERIDEREEDVAIAQARNAE